jgi:hypothetical protein
MPLGPKPPPAGPRTLRELFHYVWTYLNNLYSGIEGIIVAGGAHPPVTVADTATVDLTLTGQNIVANVVPNSIEYIELSPVVTADINARVVGPAIAVDNDVARFDGITGKLLKAGLTYQTTVIDTAAMLLRQAAFGLGTSVDCNDLGFTDFNDLIRSGFYATTGTMVSNAPPAYNALVGSYTFVCNSTPAIGQIMVTETTASGPVISYRTGNASGLGGSGTWGSWSEVPISTLTAQTSDCNTSYLKTGFYAVDGTAANSPTAADGHIFVQRAQLSPAAIAEIFVVGNTGSSSSPSPMYKRSRNGATSTWTAWHKIFDSIGQNVNTSPTGTIGFATGAGGTVTQITSKSTGVTLNKPCGNIITHNESLGGGSHVIFVLTNSQIAANDCVIVSVSAPNNEYYAIVAQVSAGSCSILLSRHGAGAASEAVTINFVVIKGAIS